MVPTSIAGEATGVPDDQSSDSGSTDRSIDIGRDAIGNAIITGNGNIVVVQTTELVRDESHEQPSADSKIGPNPYKGLLAFHEEDADRFFGREEQTARLWEMFRKLHDPPPRGESPLRLLPVLGPSGSGKSSVARAGLIPELARRPLPGWKKARVAVLTPGSHPLEAMAAVLARIATNDAVPVTKTRQFLAELKHPNDEGQRDGLRRIAAALPEIDSMPLIVVVDQFEEIYSLSDDPEERNAFVDNLLRAVTDPAPNVSVVVTLRTDFLGETQEHPQLNSALADQGVIIPAMNKDELRQAITDPARLAGQQLDEETVGLLVKETEGREGALPLLQFALTRIWEGLQEGTEPADTLKKIGGVGGALAGEAQRIYDNLPDVERNVARRVFLGLVQLGEGTRDTRRRVVVASLVAAGEDRTQVEEVVRRFSAPGVRLITLSAEPDGSETAEVTHEALFEHWRILDEWLDGSRDDLRFHRRLDQAARHWEKQQRARGILWRPPDLERMRSFRHKSQSGETPLKLTQLQTEFCLRSERAEAQRRWSRRGAVAVVIAGLVSIAIGFAVAANRAEQRRAEELVDSLLVADSSSVPDLLASIDAVRDRIRPRLEELEQQAGPEQAAMRVKLALLPEDDGQLAELNEFMLATHDIAEWKMACDVMAATEKFAKQTKERMAVALRQTAATEMSDEERVQLAKQRTRAAITLLRFGEADEVTNALYANEDPDLLAQFVDNCHSHDMPPSQLQQMLNEAADQRGDLVDDSQKRREQDALVFALLLALGEYDLSSDNEFGLASLKQQLKTWYKSDPSSAVHAAAGWLLRVALDDPPQEVEVKYSTNREWFTMKLEPSPGEGATETEIAPMYLTFVVFEPGEYQVGARDGKADDDEYPSRSTIRIERRFAVLDREITRTEFEASGLDMRVFPEFKEITFPPPNSSPTGAHAMTNPCWYDSVRFCRWLTAESPFKDLQAYADPAMLDADQYPPDKTRWSKGAPIGWPMDDSQAGFRLPTDGEWEIACRAGAESTYSFGSDRSLLTNYAWYGADKSKGHVLVGRSLRPNLRGVFDMQGNVREWCHDLDKGGSLRIVRGGGWLISFADFRSAYRIDLTPGGWSMDVGFRLAKTLPEDAE